MEKTPTNERFLERLREEFPNAKMIHVLRDPRAVLASDQAIPRSLHGRLAAAHQVLGGLEDSFRLAAERRRLPGERYLIVRYEELLADSTAASERLRTFVGTSLSWLQRQLVAAAAGDAARLFGYDRGRPSGAVRALLGLLKRTRHGI